VGLTVGSRGAASPGSGLGPGSDFSFGSGSGFGFGSALGISSEVGSVGVSAFDAGLGLALAFGSVFCFGISLNLLVRNDVGKDVGADDWSVLIMGLSFGFELDFDFGSFGFLFSCFGLSP